MTPLGNLLLQLLEGATNKPQELDDAVLRRFVSFIFFSLSLC
ncbi:putative microtubule-severing ATPase [Rosa chinensis]|uniref:Putative microtubule-severing ATPase n=1 Tax=Rosa chinensis TaxID=74649 RepID=A0A2P6PIX9_ROSCH|nr:putative microtubule-severing ATPase [Rosa chinensis]